MEEIQSIDVDKVISKLINTIISNHINSLLQHEDRSHSIAILELLIHFDMQETLKIYLSNCTSLEMQSCDNIFRDENNRLKVLDRLVQICLDKFFDKNINNNLLGNLFVICSNSPKILRNTCSILFNEGTKINDLLGYRTICSLIVFRYYLGQIIPKNIANTNVILECKTIKHCANFEQFSDPVMMSLVKILISNDIGGDMEFKLNDHAIMDGLKILVSLCDELQITQEIQEDQEIQEIEDARKLLKFFELVEANKKCEQVPQQQSEKRKKFSRRSLSLKTFNINHSKSDAARKSNSAGVIETPRK